jgi:hypothetical protein
MRNALGVELTPAEEKLATCYHSLAQVLTEHRDDLAPYQERNALKAFGALWQVMNNLDMEPGQVYHLGA